MSAESPRFPLPDETLPAESNLLGSEVRSGSQTEPTVCSRQTEADGALASGSWDETIGESQERDDASHLCKTVKYASRGERDATEPAATQAVREGLAMVPGDASPPSTPSRARQEGEPLRCGRYVLKRYHARGGMGEVWVAEDPVIGRQVALKRMFGRRPDQIQRFEVEAQVTGQLEHPGIVPIHELGYSEDGQPFYVMKFLQGRTLKKVIQEYHALKASRGHEQEVEQFRLLQIFVSLCQTVAYAHSRGVVHRDLKPDNVMQGQYGETILLDWGIAKVMGVPEEDHQGGSSSYVRLTESASSQETRAGTILGTPVYMAPEIATGRNDEVDHRSDVYLLGAILHEILTGSQPRSPKTAYELVSFAIVVPTVPPLQVCPDVSKPLDAICRKAMALAKVDRYQSALALAEDVQRFMAGEPVSAYAERLPARVWRWAKRHRKGLVRFITAATILVVVLFAGARIREVERKAHRLQTREIARRDVAEFRRLADEARFYAATTDPISEHAPYFDPRRGEATAVSALRLAGRWGTDWERLPLEEDRDSLRQVFDELRALTAQRDQKKAEASEQPKRALTALDHFLLGEGYRRASSAGQSKGKDWETDPERLEKAIEQYRLALTIKPDDYWCHFQLGRCYLRSGRFSEGIETLGACVALRPNAPWGYSTRGLALGLQRSYHRAEQDLDRALNLDPSFRPARLNRGVIFWIQGKYDEALSDFDMVLKPPKAKQLIEAAYYRGQLYLQRGEVAKALDDFNLVAASNPRFRQVYRHRARIHLAQGVKELGFKDIDACLDLAYEDDVNLAPWQARARRGRLLHDLYVELTQQRREEPIGRELAMFALDELQQAVAAGGQAPALFDDLGAMLQHTGAHGQAVIAYAKGLDLAPDDTKLLIKRAWAYQRLGRLDESLADFAHAARVAPEDAEVHSGLGYVSALRKRPSDAQREADLALLYAGDDYRVLHNVACIYVALSEIALRQASVYQDVAVSLLRKAVASWKQKNTAPSEIALIQQEPALRSLQHRADFQQLLDTEALSQ